MRHSAKKRKAQEADCDEDLPPGWHIEFKKTNRRVKIYCSPEGKRFYSKSAMERHIANERWAMCNDDAAFDRMIMKVLRVGHCRLPVAASSLTPLRIPTTPSTKTGVLATSPRNSSGKLLGSENRVADLLRKTALQCWDDIWRLEQEFTEFSLSREDVFPNPPNKDDVYSLDADVHRRVAVLMDRLDSELKNLNIVIRRVFASRRRAIAKCQRFLRPDPPNKDVLHQVDGWLQQEQLFLSCLEDNILEAKRGLGKFGRSYERKSDIRPMQIGGEISEQDTGTDGAENGNRSGKEGSDPTDGHKFTLFFQQQRAAYCAICALNHLFGACVFSYREAELLADVFHARTLMSPECLTQRITAPRLVSKRRDFPCDGFLAFEALGNLAMLQGKRLVALHRKDPTELLDCIGTRLDTDTQNKRSGVSNKRTACSKGGADARDSHNRTLPICLIHLGCANHYVVLSAAPADHGGRELVWLDSHEQVPVPESSLLALKTDRRCSSRSTNVFGAVVEAVREQSRSELERVMSPQGHVRASFFRVDDFDVNAEP
eukprot:Rmarinus@m.11969